VVGENITTGQAVCSLYDNTHLEAVVNVLEADLANLEPGRAARVAVPALRDTLEAIIDVISPTLDAASRTCEVIIRFTNESGKFRPGMFCRAEIAGFVHREKLKVPKSAILIRDDRPLVFKRNDDRAQWLYVTVGLENNHWVEILQVHSGGSLAPGEEVIVSDHLTLSHEALIKVRKTLPTVNRWAFAAVAQESSR
jgi:RND family efflux transporter MFP subunit